MSDDRVIANAEKVNKIVSLFSEPRKTLVENMLKGPVGTAYFTSPASTRDDYHSAYPGGLVEHSLNVLKHLMKLTEAMAPGRYSKETLAFVALFHDLGKSGDGDVEYYVQTDAKWKKDRGEHYEVNLNCKFMPVSERSIYILQKNGLQLDFDEYVAIRLNDGQYIDENRRWKMKEPDLAILLHWADLWATRSEKPVRNSSGGTE